jgi:hypothetical protein
VRRVLALVFGIASLAACSDPFEDAACTLDLRSHPIQVDRVVPIPFTDAAKLKVEACATREGQTPTCATANAVASDARFTVGSAPEALEGTLTKADDGNTKLTLIVHVGEGQASTTTIVRVRVLDDADNELAKAEGPVRWSDDSCHPTPDATKI